MTFSEKLQKLRREKLLSQEALAEAIGVSRQSISKWELGVAKPDIDRLLLLSEYLQVSTDYLLKDSLQEDPLAIPAQTGQAQPAPGKGADPLQTESLQAESLQADSSNPPGHDNPPDDPAPTKRVHWTLPEKIGCVCWAAAVLYCLSLVLTSSAPLHELLIFILTTLIIAAPVWFISWVIRHAVTDAVNRKHSS